VLFVEGARTPSTGRLGFFQHLFILDNTTYVPDGKES
jgi:hypothetical protein